MAGFANSWHFRATRVAFLKAQQGEGCPLHFTCGHSECKGDV